MKKKKHKPRIYLLIHSIDGVALRNKKSQTILSLLGSTPNIHIIASIDHIKAAYSNFILFFYHLIFRN